mmetsp:Transcript_47228/g.137404  ORF Transcript_47228/g.137404 Transcript_47228/m.137404 type:complete len:404 (+) Transcript_47228:1385-2596(+)
MGPHRRGLFPLDAFHRFPLCAHVSGPGRDLPRLRLALRLLRQAPRRPADARGRLCYRRAQAGDVFLADDADVDRHDLSDLEGGCLGTALAAASLLRLSAHLRCARHSVGEDLDQVRDHDRREPEGAAFGNVQDVDVVPLLRELHRDRLDCSRIRARARCKSGEVLHLQTDGQEPGGVARAVGARGHGLLWDGRAHGEGDAHANGGHHLLQLPADHQPCLGHVLLPRASSLQVDASLHRNQEGGPRREFLGVRVAPYLRRPFHLCLVDDVVVGAGAMGAAVCVPCFRDGRGLRGAGLRLLPLHAHSLGDAALRGRGRERLHRPAEVLAQADVRRRRARRVRPEGVQGAGFAEALAELADDQEANGPAERSRGRLRRRVVLQGHPRRLLVHLPLAHVDHGHLRRG